MVILAFLRHPIQITHKLAGYNSKSFLMFNSSELYQLYRSDSSCVSDASTRICVLFNQDEKEYLRRSGVDCEVTTMEERCRGAENLSSESLEESLLDNICAQTRRAKPKEQTIQPSCTETQTNTAAGVLVCIQIEEAMHLPKYLSGEERLEPISYVTCKLLENELVTGLGAQSVKPNWNFRKELRLEADRLKESCIECVVWRCVGSSIDKTNDLQIGTAKIDTAPLFLGKYKNTFFEKKEFFKL